MWKSISGVFGAPFEELQEKLGVGPQLQVFSGVRVAGARRVWHGMLVELVEFLEWSSAKHSNKFVMCRNMYTCTSWYIIGDSIFKCTMHCTVDLQFDAD